MQDHSPTFDPDVPYRVRSVVGPVVTRAARLLGQPEYQLRQTEYVGTVSLPMGELKSVLRDRGFDWGPISWYHQPSVGSDPDGSWTYRDSPFADRQLHAILIHRAPDRIDVFAHEEYNWRRHPLRHWRQVGIDRAGGAETMQAWLTDQGVAVDGRSRTRRKVARLVTRATEPLYTRLTSSD